MKIKRYVDTDMRHVLRRVRQDQGPDAVILSNRRVDEGIEVIAAIDYDEALIQQALGSQARADDYRAIADGDIADSDISYGDITDNAHADNDIADSQIADTTDDCTDRTVNAQREPVAQAAIAAKALQPAAADDDAGGDSESISDPLAAQATLHGVRSELSSLRELVEAQLSCLVWKDGARRSPIRAQVLRNLARLGVAPDIAYIVVNRLEPIQEIKQIWRSPLGELAQLIPVKEDTLLTAGGTIALIGPTGVGKTTTIAKIAARYSMQQGSDEVALICADAYRIGAKEHLTAFGNIIGVKVHAASSSAELTELLDRLQSKKLILIDTEGMSQRDIDLSDRLAAYGSNEARVHFYLTLSASSQEAVLDETIRCFNKVPLSGTVVTKIDEAAQLGCIISALIRNDLPIAWLSNGQRIPDDLYAAARKRLWLVNQAVEVMEASEPRIDEQTMAERYTQVSVAHA